MKANAFSAQFGVDYVDVIAFGNSFVGAFGLAGAAINAILSYFCGHRIRGTDAARAISCAEFLEGCPGGVNRRRLFG